MQQQRQDQTMAESSQVSAAKPLLGSPITNDMMSRLQKFALSHRMLATVNETLHKLSNKESQQAIRPIGAQSSGDPDESESNADLESEVWEEAEDYIEV